jgi:hypothetical protein
MSGNDLDYLQYRLQELSELIARKSTCVEHRAFANHLGKCADAAIMLANALGGYCSPGDEIPLIRSILTPADILDRAIDEAHEAEKTLRAELERACGKTGKQLYQTSFS